MLKKLTILLLILTFPSVLYVVLTVGKTNFIRLPHFGAYTLASNGKDTIFHAIPPFSFINQEGERITDKTFNGKIYVASYFYADCNSITCQKVTTELLRVQEKFMYTSQTVQILSHTMQPEKDSVPQLKKYFNMVHADAKMWNFVTGDKNQLYSLAKNDYLLNSTIPNKPANDSIIHNERVVLIDKEKHIRGFYDATDIKQINNLLDDIKVLTAEYFIKENEKKK